MKTKATILFSGGIDSTACLRFYRDRGHEVEAVFVDFGQPAAAAERTAVGLLRCELGINVTILEAKPALEFETGELSGRNAFLIFASILLGGCEGGLLAIGIHAGTRYFDCSPQFIEQIRPLVENCTNGRISVVAPFAQWSKDDVYSFFATLNVPIAKTYSCEAGTTPPCGKCASCKDRVRFEC